MKPISLFPNIFQIAFMEGFYKKKADNYVNDRLNLFKKRGERFFRNYEKIIEDSVILKTDYQNQLFRTKDSKIIIQQNDNGKVYLYPTNDFSKVIDFLNKNGITEFPKEYYAVVNDVPQIVKEGVRYVVKLSKNINLTVITDIFTGPVKGTKLKSGAQENLYLEYFGNNIELPNIGVELPTGGKIPAAKVLEINDSIKIIYKVAYEPPDLKSFVYDAEPNLQLVKKDTFSSYIGSESLKTSKNIIGNDFYMNSVDKNLITDIDHELKLFREINDLKLLNQMVSNSRITNITNLIKSIIENCVNHINNGIDVLTEFFTKKSAIRTSFGQNIQKVSIGNKNTAKSMVENYNKLREIYNESYRSSLKNIDLTNISERLKKIENFALYVKSFIEEFDNIGHKYLQIKNALTNENLEDKLIKFVGVVLLLNRFADELKNQNI